MLLPCEQAAPSGEVGWGHGQLATSIPSAQGAAGAAAWPQGAAGSCAEEPAG